MKDLTKWEILGGELDIPGRLLDGIREDYFHKGIQFQKSKMIETWLKSDTEQSWDKLCKALEEMDEKVLAKNIRTSFC